MNRDTVQGKIDEVVGSAKQKTGKLIGNPTLEVKGIAQRAKGKIENVLGKTKDAIHESNVPANPPQDRRP
ncbi:MAG: CsbD family protein [Terracidiphilus sp.]